MTPILLPVFLLFGITPLSYAASVCYYPDGISSTDFTPCTDDDSSFSACCAVGDECLTDGLCKATGMRSSTAFWRNLCTDATWQSDACPKYCYNESTSHEASAQSNFVLACSNTTYCCAEQSLALSSGNYSYCCGDEDALFTAAPAVHLAGPQNPLPLFTSIASTSVFASASALASSPSSATTGTSSGTGIDAATSTEGPTVQPVNNNGPSLSTGAKAGIGAGVAAAVIIIATVLFMIRRSKAKGNREELKKIPAEPSTKKRGGYGSPQCEQKIGELSDSQAVLEKEAESKVPELYNDGARFELGGGRRPVELEGVVR